MVGKNKNPLKAYSYLALKILPKFYRKLPKLLWGTAAVFGILVVGVLLGIKWRDSASSNQDYPQNQQTLDEQYLKLIDAYGEANSQNYNHVQSIDTLTNYNPQDPNAISKFTDALNDLKSWRDIMLIEQGRIFELKKAAGLSSKNPIN